VTQTLAISILGLTGLSTQLIELLLVCSVDDILTTVQGTEQELKSSLTTPTKIEKIVGHPVLVKVVVIRMMTITMIGSLMSRA
jgi:hypothetical protein